MLRSVASTSETRENTLGRAKAAAELVLKRPILQAVQKYRAVAFFFSRE